MNIQEQLERDEGREKRPYQDQFGWWTGGIGHNFQTKLLSEVPSQFTPEMSDAQIDGLFQADLNHVNHLLDVYFPWHTTKPDFVIGVLQNMGFNLGVPKLSHFNTFLQYVRDGQFDQAAEDLRHTAVFAELPERYERLAKQLETGEWQ